jgi:methylmalonyl-CoA/ethylmalonyl-CoA epimerase
MYPIEVDNPGGSTTGLAGGNQVIKRIKHMAVAVEDVDHAAKTYEDVLGVAIRTRVDWEKGRSREAHLDLGEVEIQLCQSMDSDGRFAQHIQRHGPGVQHVCLEVDNIEEAIAGAVRAGAHLKACKACDKIGAHPHSEGYVAFLEGQVVPGMEIEFMQMYLEGERPVDYAAGV